MGQVDGEPSVMDVSAGRTTRGLRRLCPRLSAAGRIDLQHLSCPSLCESQDHSAVFTLLSPSESFQGFWFFIACVCVDSRT